MLSLLLVLASALAQAPNEAFSMAPFRAACAEETRPYASCHDQRQILSAGLTDAAAAGRPILLVVGFNDCPPCNLLDRWMNKPEQAVRLAPYTLVKLSILDAERQTRPEVFSQIIPALSLPINSAPPFGVPYFAVLDPVSRAIVGEGLTGFDTEDPSAHLAYLKAPAGDGAPEQ